MEIETLVLDAINICVLCVLNLKNWCVPSIASINIVHSTFDAQFALMQQALTLQAA